MYKIKHINLSLIVLVIFLLVVFFFTTELYMRSSATYTIKNDDKNFFLAQSNVESIIFDTLAGRRMRPNVQVTILNHYISHKNIIMETNSLGFRDEEIVKEKGENDLRIIALGDSITLGDYLQKNEVYVERLEDYLNSHQSQKHVSVINAGVGDVGLKEEVDILSEKGFSLKPDIVLLAFYLNDSRPPWGFPKEIRYKGWLRSHSVLADTLYKNLVLRKWIKEKGIDRLDWADGENLDWKHNREAFLQFAKKAEYDWGAAWNLNSWQIIDEELEKLRLLSKTNGFSVVVVVFPVAYQVYSDFFENTPQRILQEKTEKLGFHYIDILPILRENKNRDLYFDWAHPKEYANDLIGKHIANTLLDGVLKGYIK